MAEETIPTVVSAHESAHKEAESMIQRLICRVRSHKWSHIWRTRDDDSIINQCDCCKSWRVGDPDGVVWRVRPERSDDLLPRELYVAIE